MQQTVKGVDRQSFYDVTAQVYGNIYALQQFISDNVKSDFDISAPIVIGAPFVFDIENSVASKPTLRKTQGKYFRTYNTFEYEDAEYNTDFDLDFTS